MPGLMLGENVRFWGKPPIDIRNGGEITIGKNTQILSPNIGMHVNYGTPAKLFVDRPGAKNSNWRKLQHCGSVHPRI